MVTNVLTSYYKLDQDGVSSKVLTPYIADGRMSSHILRSILTPKNLTGRGLTIRTSRFVRKPTLPSFGNSLLPQRSY